MAVITIRVFASHPVAAAQYVRVLTAQKDFRVVREQDRYQVGVFDSQSPSIETVLTLARLKLPSMRPLLLSFSLDENECLRWLFRGVWGLVTYDRYEEDLPRAVCRLAEGQLWYPAPVIIRWMRIDAARHTFALHSALTRREREVLEFLLRRFSNKEIAGILGISERLSSFMWAMSSTSCK